MTNNSVDGEISSARSSYTIKFKGALWLFTTGAQFVLGWWYRSKPVFFLPPGWLGPFTWWLALPFAPKGSVSCGVWQMACRRVIKVGERVVKDLAGESFQPSEMM
jgi:tail-anchored protein insertion receptor